MALLVRLFAALTALGWWEGFRRRVSALIARARPQQAARRLAPPSCQPGTCIITTEPGEEPPHGARAQNAGSHPMSSTRARMGGHPPLLENHVRLS